MPLARAARVLWRLHLGDMLRRLLSRLQKFRNAGLVLCFKVEALVRLVHPSTRASLQLARQRLAVALRGRALVAATFAALLQSATLLLFHAKRCCATAHWIAVHQPVTVSVPQAACLIIVVSLQQLLTMNLV